MCLPFERFHLKICIHFHIYNWILSNCPTLSMDSPSMCRLGSFPQICSPPDRTQDFVSATLLFSGYTSSRFMLRRVSGEQRGGAVEIMRRIGRRAWGNEFNLHILGWD